MGPAHSGLVVRAGFRAPDPESARLRFVVLCDRSPTRRPSPIYLVRPGCGNGRLRWQDVRHALSEILDDRFVIVEREPPRD